MKVRFRDKLRLNKKNQKQLIIINKIIDEYKNQGYTLTLRQLFYQLVSRDIIPNETKEYSKLSGLLVKGRMSGVVDWEAIEDRIRVPYIPSAWDSPEEIIESAIYTYRRNRQEGQKVYIELWVEKDALSGVLKKITEKYHINLMVNRGYSSCTAMHDSFKRLKEEEIKGKQTYILYLGDHDPSGLDMIRDIKDRLEEFGVNPEVRQIGLTMDQIRNFNPPPNPAKVKDPRATEYIKKYGRTSWEVDALNPETLNRLVKENVEGLISAKLFNDSLRKEEQDKLKLKELAKGKEENDG